MSLFFTGCSHTYGDDLTDREAEAWPTLVAKAKNKKFINLATSGGSNDRIVSQIIKNSNDYDHFYIAWTYVERFMRHRPDIINSEVIFNPQLKNSKYGDKFYFIEYGKLHYTEWYNDLSSFKLWLQQIILVQRFLESKNKKYTMINACSNNIQDWTAEWDTFTNSSNKLLRSSSKELLLKEYNEIQNLISEINLTRFVGWGDWCITDLNTSYPVGATNHLLSAGHQAIANYILTHDTN